MKLLLVTVGAALIGVTLLAQSADVEALRARLRIRYDIATLQDGLALIPRARDPRTRLIEVRDGAISINGEAVTAREVRDRLGSDADAVLRLTYLTRDDQRRLAQAESAPAVAPPSPTLPPVPTPPETPTPPREVRRQEVTRLGGDVTVEANQHVAGDVSAIMGSARIEGEVEGDVSAVMGSVTLGPQAVVHGDVNAIGGTVSRSPTARVDGDVNTIGLGDRSPERRQFGDVMRRAFAWRVAGLAGTLVRIALLVLLTLVVAAFGQGVVARIADRTASDVVRAGLVGLMAEVLFVPVVIITIVVLAISIIGIPLLLLVPFAIILALVMVLVGFTGVARHLGRSLQARFGWGSGGDYSTVVTGVLVIVFVTMVARTVAFVAGGLLGFPLAALGYLIEYAAWTIGFGAALLTWNEIRRQRHTVIPPPLPE